MQTKKMTKSILILLTLLTSLNSYAEGYKFLCNNESEDGPEGEIYYEVQGRINPENLTLANVTLDQNQISRRSDGLLDDKLLDQTKVNTLNPESRDQNTIVYSFDGNISGQNQNVKITFLKDAVSGLKYRISVDNESLSWCTPLHK